MAETYEKQPAVIPWPAKVVSGLIVMVIGTVLYNAGTFESVNKAAEGFGLPLDLGKTIATIGVLLILFPVVEIFFIKPLADAIKERNTDLERTFTEAEQLREDMTKLRTDYEGRLVATEAQARTEIQSQIKEAQNLRKTLMDEASQRADAMVVQAQAQIAQERDRAVLQIRTEVVDLALAAAEKVIGENLNDERNRRLVQNFVDRVEVAA
ncbi:hypothetical protein BH11ARM2_BH11ARM2_34110 [soil metagenome]